MAVNCICPGCANVWVQNAAGNGWEQLIDVDSWNITANVTEPNKKVTSHTNQIASAFCGGSTSFQAEVVVTLCPNKGWLFCHLLTDPRVMSGGREVWWFFGFDCLNAGAAGVAPDTNAAAADFGVAANMLDPASSKVGNVAGAIPSFSPAIAAGVLFHGKVNAPGFGIDNTNQDVATASFTIELGAGPYLPDTECPAFTPEVP